MDDTKLTAIQAAIDSLSARLDKLDKTNTPAAETPEQLSAKLGQVAELAAENAFKKFAAKFGATPPAAPSAEGKAPEKEAPKKFEELVRAHAKYSENKALAIGETVAAHPQAHADYQLRVKGGEVILF